MKILILCKASAHIGMGHLIRSRTFAQAISKELKDIEINFFVIGDRLVHNLLQGLPFPVSHFEEGAELPFAEKYDLAFFDTIHLAPKIFAAVKKKSTLCISLSPIFDHMPEVDILFNRTRYIRPEYEELSIHKYLGLEYTLIQANCTKINSVIYQANLDRVNFPIAISMGGGDAPNKTLRFLRSLKRCSIPATFWVMLGEGYGHSYDDLIQEIKKDSTHEIILAKTNQSMWHILSNCVLAILPGGITSYEAIYAGLPAINIVDKESSYFLLQEPEEKGACFYGGILSDEALDDLNTKIVSLYENREQLLAIHESAQNLIDDQAGVRIIQICQKHLAKKVQYQN